VLIILLVIVTGLFTWQYLKSSEQATKIIIINKEKKVLTDQKDSLQRDFENLLGNFNDLKTTNEDINKQLESQKEEIANYLGKIKKLEKNSKELAFYKKKLEELTSLKDNFAAQIDSLTAANKVLQDENSNIKTDLEKKTGENTALNDKVNRAQKVKGANIAVQAFNEKGKPQKKAKKVSSLRICITLLENEIAPAGNKEVFFRIIDSKGNVLYNSEENLFESGGQKIAYSMKNNIEYQNKTVQACGSYKVKEGEVITGSYDVEAYTDGELVGRTSIALE
jgi:DNA repair ATPase RecN